MSSLFKSTIIKGNRLTDFANTTATVGLVIPWGFGAFTSNGNAIWAHLPPTEHVSRKRQGKGGTKVETYTYTLNYAVAFAKGQLYGYKWIKRAGKVVYTNDPNAPVEDQEYAAKWLQKATLYYGTRDQAPDSTIESYEGTGMVSAFKDLGYIVLEEDDVTDNGGAVPNYEACVIASPPEAYLTSKLYPQYMQEEVDLGLSVTGGSMVTLLYDSDMQPSETELGVAPTGGEMFQPPPAILQDSDTNLGLVLDGGDLFEPPPGLLEPAETEPSLVPSGGVMKVPPSGDLLGEELDIGLVVTGGSMVTTIFPQDTFWDSTAKGAAVVLSSLDQNATVAGGSYDSVYANNGKTAGKWQFEIVIAELPSGGANGPFIGIADKSDPALVNGQLNSYFETCSWFCPGTYYVKLTGDEASVALSSFVANDVFTHTLDLDAVPPELNVYKNGTLALTRSLPAGKEWFPCTSIRRSSVVKLRTLNLDYPQAGFIELG